jgi:hypothetical protein
MGHSERENFLGCGPHINEFGRYQHGVFCSGGDRNPRRPGNSCSCHRCDLFYQKLDIVRQENGDVKRTLRVAACPGCHNRTEFPFPEQPVPKEVFCQQCSIWSPVETLSWEGEDFSKLLPVIPK